MGFEANLKRIWSIFETNSKPVRTLKRILKNKRSEAIEANSFEASSVFSGAIFTEAKFADNSLGIVTK